MVTNLMTVESIGFGQLVRVREIRVAAADVWRVSRFWCISWARRLSTAHFWCVKAL